MATAAEDSIPSDSEEERVTGSDSAPTSNPVEEAPSAPPASTTSEEVLDASSPEILCDDDVGSVEMTHRSNNRRTTPSRRSTLGSRSAPEISTFDDHFTLQLPSALIRYRHKKAAARVFETPEAQFVLEETVSDDNVHHVSVRRIHHTPTGVQALRIMYATVTAFWTGFLFVFCLEILLFLFLDLALQSGATTKQQANWAQAIGAVLAFPGFVYAFACALVIAGAFIYDTWKGHLLIRNFTFRRMKEATVEWIFFLFFLGIPIFVMGCLLLARNDRWWEYTLLVWFSSVVGFYCLFAANVVFYEMKACWDVTKHKNHHDNTGWPDLIRKSIMSRQIHEYSGRQVITFLSIGSIQDAEYTDSDNRDNAVNETKEVYLSWKTRATMWPKLQEWGLYEIVPEKTERIYSIDDARDVRPFVTSQSWNLESVFCRPRNSRYIAIVQGPGALTPAQIKSSLVCSLVGSLLIFFIQVAVLVYLSLGAIFTILGIVVVVWLALPSFRSTYRLYTTRTELVASITKSFQKLLIATKLSRDDVNQDDAETGIDNNENDAAEGNESVTPEESQCVYLQQEIYRVTRPTPRFCWFMFCLELALFYVYPLAALYRVGNVPLATMFLFFVGISLARYYVNAAVVLEETGRMDLVDGKTKEELWKEQSRLNQIVGNITRGRGLNAWITVLASVGIIFLALMLGAVGTSQTSPDSTTTVTYANNYSYEQQDSLRYPSCQLSADLGLSPFKQMSEYAFLAGLAYESVNSTQQNLDTFFNGMLNATDEVEIVEQYRQMADTPSHVSFKLVTVPVKSGGTFAYVLIRGTINNWDMLTDAQLWSAAALMQVLRELLPLGAIWTPIIDQLIDAITGLESTSLQSVSFYKDTTDFVEYVKTLGYEGIVITGHSLGGGLSIITGAQTQTPAVALSGPNAMLSRRSFDPRLSIEELDSSTFNIIPERDLVPMIDDVAQNFQHIRCQAAFEDVIGCHSASRSLCEILYSCGSRGHAIPCSCVKEFKYSEPKQIDRTFTASFKEVCGIED